MHHVTKPADTSEYTEQMRPPITKSTGFTETERYLAYLGEKTFLGLWSYPSPYREQKLLGAGDGKELCDLLVVCDPHVIIFSEKEISWTDAKLEVAWARWAKRAVFDAAKQLRGAERWINEFPDRIFLDKECRKPFPLKLPDESRRRIHRIVVARGAAEACRKHFDGGSGTLVVRPELKGVQHLGSQSAGSMPFCIGDIEPTEDFVHVFDEVALDVVMRELDTISDFTAYLDKRSAFIRSGRLGMATGEEDLLAYYASRVNDAGEHDFSPPDGKAWEDIGPLLIDGGYGVMTSDPRYLAKKEADRASYFWDHLIQLFTDHLLGGTSIVPPGFEFRLTDSEQAVRYMALETRFMRRNLARAALGALEEGRKRQMFFRLFAGAKPTDHTGFFILTVKYLDWMKKRGGYNRYREGRSGMMRAYAQAVLMEHSHLKRVVGVGMEPMGQGGGTSEDNLLMLQQEWSAEARAEHAKLCESLGIWRSLKPQPYHDNEYPDPAPSRRKGANKEGNRKMRRAAEAKARKRQR